MVCKITFFSALLLPLVQCEKMLRFSCSGLVTQRLDPIVQAGKSPSQHVHQIVGGDAFNMSMDPASFDVPGESSCTTCTFTEDKSNYWTPNMYFRARNGTFKRVPQIANEGFQGANGGMTVYYTTPDDASFNITAFKPGFRMVTGDPTKRSSSFDGSMNLYRCYTGSNFEPNPMGVSDADTSEFPKGYCVGGIRVNIFFPTCWDGVNIDSEDHKSHMSFGQGNGCPSSHPVRVPQVFFESVWDTGIFPQSEWPEDGSQPFVWSQGDLTGYGHHADYLFGWEGDSLQRAMDARCDFMECPELKTQGFAEGNQCTQKPVVNEDVDGC
ncbi:hypothetical protein BS50DRAFT_12083 [Corynespora cassiicola Philippines]|uniref:DUF1996 domain-containing protein n=1 Tax=Corynespora cassiicola Philippines TaxID=1448308 RepID=A0A2T2P9E7_CORCC|nr:hypothetical protein BS50DRAFT_12083 [Corynespora cassiicola Philippines]